MVAASELPIETVASGTSATDMAETIFGDGVTVVSATYYGDTDSAGTYSGKPVVVHRALPGVEPDDFTRWLALFNATLADTAPTPEAVSYLALRAERIAQSLSMAMFDRTEHGTPALN